MKKIISLILTALISVSLAAGCSKKDEGTLTVGFDEGFPPMGFVDSNGKHVGFDLDLAAEVAKRLNMQVKLQPIDWDSKTFELESGNIDCIWNGFTITGRENDYEWTTPYMKNYQVIVVKDSDTYETLADLSGKKLALQQDSSAESALDANPDFKNSLSDVTFTDTNLSALMQLTAGAVDCVLMDEIVARYNIEKQNGKYKVISETLAPEDYGVGFKLGNTELRDKVQNALQEMANDGTLAKISDEWFGKDITTIVKTK